MFATVLSYIKLYENLQAYETLQF